MSKNELFFKSSDNMTSIHMVSWIPEGEVLGIVHICHGVSEHIGRYEDVANYLNKFGILVVGIDYLGHGLSTNAGDKKMYFGPEGSYKLVLEDIDHLVKETKQNYPNIPYVMLGLSLGSFFTRAYCMDHPEEIDGAVLLGTSYMTKLLYKGARVIINRELKKYGEEVPTENVRKLAFGSYNKRFQPNRTAYDWLIKSEKAVDDYVADPLRGGNLTVGVFREMLNVMLYASLPENLKKIKKDLPFILLSGEEDYVGDRGKKVYKVASLLKNAGINNVSVKIYPTLRHSILQEDEKYLICNDIMDWIKDNKLMLESTKKNNVDVEIEESKIDGLVDYDKYDIAWPEAADSIKE